MDYSCDDLSPVEHDQLAALSRRRHKPTGAVAVNGTPVPVLDALVETGFLRRAEEGWVLILRPCAGHPVSPGDLRASARGIIPAEPDKHIRARSLSGQPAACSSARLSIKSLVDSFATQSKLHCWGASINAYGRDALAGSIKRWVADGAELEEIDRMIDIFFADIKGQEHKGGHLWKMFLARKQQLYIGLERERIAVEAQSHRGDLEYWSQGISRW